MKKIFVKPSVDFKNMGESLLTQNSLEVKGLPGTGNGGGSGAGGIIEGDAKGSSVSFDF